MKQLQSKQIKEKQIGPGLSSKNKLHTCKKTNDPVHIWLSDLSKAYIECVERAHEDNGNLCWGKKAEWELLVER